MPSGIINISLHSHGPSAAVRRAASFQTANASLHRDCLLSALQNRATAYYPPSIAVLPPPPYPPEPRCRLLPALWSRAAASMDPTPRPPEPRCRLLTTLQSCAAASKSPPSRTMLPSPAPLPSEPCTLPPPSHTAVPALQSARHPLRASAT